MREPSGHGIRGARGRGCLLALVLLACFGVRDAGAQAITRYTRDTGHINFVTTGGSFRNADNNTNACSVDTTSSQSLSGIPGGTTIRNAYLYWGASGNSADTSVTLNGSTVTASRTFSRTFNNGTSFNFYGAFADVTSLVPGNGTYTVGNVNISVGTPWCGSQAVVGGWALVVIYESASERLRAINVFDGLDYFYGSSVTLTPDGFRVPPSNIDGRIAVFTLEGDPGNSGTQGGVDEALRFNGTLLDDGLVPANSVPTVQQFDGTINSVGAPNNVQSYGIDVDQYDVSSMLSPGQTSATTVYSAGADLVLLMAQIVSATSDPAVDLTVTSTHTGSFISGTTGTYTLTVSNLASAEREDNTVTVKDTLPAGLTYSSFTGTGWSCSAAAQVVTCTHPATLNPGASFPALNLVVNVTEAAANSVTNSVTVSTPSYELVTSNNTATDVTTTIDPNVSTSTKSVVDLNGGEASPGDTLRYTVTLNESAGGQAINVVLTDDVPANTTFGGFVSIPAGATSAFTAAPAGANNQGLITVSGITIPASSSVTVVFDVTVANVSPGSTIDNEATITNPNGPDAAPDAPQVIVNPSLLPGSGTKQLYLWSSPLELSRTRPTGSHPVQTINGNNQNLTFTLTPALQKAVTLNSGNFAVNLLLARSGSNFNTSRTVTVTLSNSVLGTIGSDSVTFTQTAVTMRTFTINTAGVTAPSGSTFTLTVNNNSNNTSNRSVQLTPYTGASYSRVDLDSATVINVDSVQAWNAAFNGGAQQSTYYPGATVFVRATVSDPFGSFDISSATVSLVDPNGTTVVTNAPMVAQGAPATCGSTSSATCVFQYSYPLGASPVLGAWTIRVTANEGVEGVFDLGVGSFTVVVPQPSLTMAKTSTVISDPTNNTTNPKRIPQSVVRYDITVTNSGPGTVDAGTLVITDAIPTSSSMYVLASGNPVVFLGSTTPPVGLTFTYPANVSYSNVGDTGPWTYTPSPDANGFDAAVRAVRITPSGTMNAAGGGNPSFTVQFRVRIN